MPTVGMIWAQTPGRVIGRDGAMPWHVPEDLAYFKTVTQGAPVIMGRKTWESLPERFRPLPGRVNVVVTRDTSKTLPLAEGGALTASSLEDALSLAGEHTYDSPAVWIMGGGAIYSEAVEKGLAEIAAVTQIDLDVDGDTFAPQLDPQEWTLVSAMPEQGWETSQSGTRYRFETYRRMRPAPHAPA
ncbi:dihydrofolate reductase [Nesterenkonia flava]|uniref:Dihydrofolate reductase n=1 Tax=Nesterenkonia flava TaxID=469799 RepID=A0ABU1FU06_9MICC|nr:dihydrofolate reductase [Nesterenkonia flava]MDR5712149.1 dihydrofolate reductase [Nesterenkonia flava]